MTQAMSKLESQILEAQSRDAASVKRAFSAVWRFLSEAHDPSGDAMEQAKLACQKRDLAGLRAAVAAVTHASQSRNAGPAGAARA